jgi:uncharacterized protein (TIGR02996 family)
MASRSTGSKPLSEKQRNLLGNLIYRYRRQLKLSDSSARKYRERIQMPPVEAPPLTQDEAFLAAIIADPANDSARCAYADYLQERGDPRGEFIAIQLALAKLPSPLPLMPTIWHCKIRRPGRNIVDPSGMPIVWEQMGSYLDGECHEELLRPFLERSSPKKANRTIGLLGGSGLLVRIEQEMGNGCFTCPKCALEVRPQRPGQPMIRVRLHLLPLEPAEQQAEDLRKRERELLGDIRSLDSNAVGWMGPFLWNYTFGCSGEAVFRRGFVEKISLPASVWLELADELRKAAPLREVVWVQFLHPDWFEVLTRWQVKHLKSERILGLADLREIWNDLWPGIYFTILNPLDFEVA